MYDEEKRFLNEIAKQVPKTALGKMILIMITKFDRNRRSIFSKFQHGLLNHGFDTELEFLAKALNLKYLLDFSNGWS